MERILELPNKQQVYRGSVKVATYVFDTYKDRAEKEFIINSLSNLPIEKLKELVCFEIINPYDKSIPKSIEDAEYRCKLMDERVVEFRMEILI